jgi:hypothetical protein
MFMALVVSAFHVTLKVSWWVVQYVSPVLQASFQLHLIMIFTVNLT